MRSGNIKVLFLIHKLGIGGAEQRLLSFLKYEISNNYFSFSVLCLEEKGIIGEEISNLGIAVKVLNSKSRIRKIMDLFFFLMASKPDIVHVHLWPARLYSPIIKFFSKAILIYTLESKQEKNSNLLIFLEKVFYLFSDRIIAVSEYVKKTYCAVVRVNEKKIFTIYNGVNISEFDSLGNNCFRKGLGIKDDQILITSVARLSKNKGLVYLIRAAQLLKKKYNYLKFVVVGEGRHRDDLVREIKELGLNDMIILVGYRRDIVSILSSTDIFVLPSINEAQGIALLEAMASGRAIVTTNISGIDEVANETNSIIVAPKDDFSLAKGIEELVIDKKKRLQLGKEARRHVQTNFPLESMCREYEKLYYEISKKN